MPAASSYLYVSLGQAPFQVISADGVDIEPVWTKEILIGMAETYDILYTVPEHKNYELKVTSQDVTGYASGWIGMGEKISAPAKPMPDMYASMDHGAHGGHAEHGASHAGHGAGSGASEHTGHNAAPPHGPHHPPVKAGHAGMDHSQHQSGNDQAHGAMAGHQMPGNHAKHAKHANHATEKDSSDGDGAKQAAMKDDAQHGAHSGQGTIGPRAEPVIESLTVDNLKALNSTVLPKGAPVRDVKLVLSGDMERYIWYINGKAIHQDRYIEINEGEVVRFTYVNETMMHHPMHLHGHFFRVINQFGDRSPLKHTVDVPPHSTRVIEFYANEPGQWMLHCHNLYHMDNGMARVVKYTSYKPSPELAKHTGHDPHMHDHTYVTGILEAATNHGQAQVTISKTWDVLHGRIETKKEDRRWAFEGDLLYKRYFSNFLYATLGGSTFESQPRAVAGIGYMLPLLFETQLLVDHKGTFRFDVDKRLQWTSHIFSDAELTIRQNYKPEWEVSLMYGPSWAWSGGVMLTEEKLGAGIEWRF
jgi:FtsP/CotA-like multicopper oxidase with cupredoxin domain